MCACTTSVKVLSPRVDISAVAVAMFTLAWLNKKNQKENQKMNNRQPPSHKPPSLWLTTSLTSTESFAKVDKKIWKFTSK